MSSADAGGVSGVPAVSVRGLHYTFRSLRPVDEGGGARRIGRPRETIRALRNVTFGVAVGDSVALLGANGAGKSTLIKILAGVLHPTKGSVELHGLDPWKSRRQYRKQIGVVFGHRSQLWWDLPVVESLRFLGIVYQVERREIRSKLELLTNVLDLDPLLHTPVRELSLGQRMRCEIAASLIHSPKVLLLDEPTIGLDIISRVQLREHLRVLAAEKRCTVLLSSHDLLDVEGVTGRLLILEEGGLVYDDSLHRLWETLAPRTVDVSVVLDEPTSPDLQSKLSTCGGELLTDENGFVAGDAGLSFRIDRDRLVGALGIILDHGGVLDIRIDRPSIEQIIVNLYRSRDRE